MNGHCSISSEFYWGMYKGGPSRCKRRKSADSSMYHSSRYPHSHLQYQERFTSSPHSSLVERCTLACLFDLTFPLYTQTDSNRTSLACVWDFVGRRKHILMYFSLSPVELIPSFSPVFFLGLMAVCEHYGGGISEDLQLSPPSTPKSTHMFMSFVPGC